MKYCLPFLFLCNILYSQHNITASVVETWNTETAIPADFNLNSAYVYFLNAGSLEKIFAGEDLNKRERKDVGVHKGDYPQYMYLGVSIKDPVNDNGELTIPLMIHDIRDPANQSRVVEYGGRFLSNIPDEELKNGDIVAKVRFEAFRGNNTADFWEKTAKISMDLGRTATNLLANPLTGTFAALSSQIIPQVDQGLRSMSQAQDDPNKLSSEFYIRLMSKELSALYAERIASTTLYRIHWDVSKVAETRYFNNAEINAVDDFQELIHRRDVPYILVINTKSEYNTDHSELVYTQAYIDKKSSDFRKIRNAEKREVEKHFLEALKLALELKSQIEVFSNSLNTKYPDWKAFSRVIDLYYDIRAQEQQEQGDLVDADPMIRSKYTRLYTNVRTDVDLWFTSELLGRARAIADYLVTHPKEYSAEGLTADEIYADVSLLDFYRDRAQQTKIQGKLPKEIESLETYALSVRKLEEIENALFEKAFQPDPRLGPAAQKVWLTDMASKQYPLCQACARRVGEELARIENATHAQNIQTYRNLSAEYYDKLGCYETVYQELDSLVQANTDSLTMSPFMLESIKQDQQAFINLSSEYIDIVGQDYTKMTPEELSELINRYRLNNQKMKGVLDRLQGAMMREEMDGCFF